MFGIFKSMNNTKILQDKIEYLHDELDILADSYVTMESHYRKEIRLLNKKIKALESTPIKTVIKYKGKL